MAANIEVREINGVEVGSFAGFGPAWHGLGEVFDRPMTVIEALKASHADYKVTLENTAVLNAELMDKINRGVMIDPDELKNAIIEGHKATYRADYDEVLGVVSDKYGIIQNTDAFKFIDSLCGEFGKDSPIIDAAGVLGHGERIFITAKMPEPIALDHRTDDVVNMYIVFTTSHDGKGGCCAMVTPVRVVCQNTLNAALNAKGHISRWNIRHSANCNDRLANIRYAAETLKLYDTYKKEFEAKFAQLKSVNVTDEQVKDVIARTIMTPEVLKNYYSDKEVSTRTLNTLDRMTEYVYDGIGQDAKYGRGNGLWLYNGITSFYANEANYKSADHRFGSLLDESGNAYKKTNKSFDLILGLAA